MGRILIQLSDLLEQVCQDHYFLLNRAIRHVETKRQYMIAIRDFSEAINHEPCVIDLHDDNIGRLMAYLDGQGLATRTINERRGRIHALWTWLCKRGVLSEWPTTAKLPEPVRCPLAWRKEEIQALFAAAATTRGKLDTVPKWLFWTALLSVMWDSGERIGALLQIEWQHVDMESRWLYIPAELRKGGRRDMTYRLSPETVDALKHLKAHKTRLVFHWPRNRTYLWQAFGEVIRHAGLPQVSRQKFHRLRRSVATHLKGMGGDPQSQMGHSSAAVTGKYIDPRIYPSAQPCDVLFRPGKTGS
jgi:integrase